MIITISGDIGSGKSTASKLLCKELGFKYLSTGAIQRNIAEEMGLTTLELNLLTESRKDIDDRIDSYTKNLNGSPENYVVDSRLAWHFIPSSYKIYLRCPNEIAALRISKDSIRKSDEEVKDIHFLTEKISKRRQSEKRRFLRIYQIDFEDLSNYDLIIDSSYFTPEEMLDLILEGLRLAD